MMSISAMEMTAESDPEEDSGEVLEGGSEDSAGDSPAENPNLEYDPEFIALDELAKPKPEKVMGDTVVPGEAPMWPDVVSAAESLLERSKDLRIVMHWLIASTNLRGLPGLAEGLSKIRGLLESDWDSVHPQLDVEDNNDPTLRINSLAALSDPAVGLRLLRETPFVSSPQIGKFSIRDLSFARGDAQPPEGVSAPTVEAIEAACREVGDSEFGESLDAVTQIAEHLPAIESIFSDKVSNGPDLDAMRAMVKPLLQFLKARAGERQPMESVATDDGADAGSGGDGTQPARRGGGGVSSPEDVVRVIDEICNYYQRFEPSSPVPILLRRAQRLVGKSFMDILNDMAPSGVDQMRVFEGNPP